MTHPRTHDRGLRRRLGSAVPVLAALALWAAPGGAQLQFDTPGKEHLVPAPSPTFFGTSVALGDLDGDGDQDLVGAGVAQPNRVGLNDGTGIFLDAPEGSLPGETQWSFAVALADVDGDSDLDAILGNAFTEPQNQLALNDGSGVFTDVTITQMPLDADSTWALAVGDLDDDGDPDLVVGNLEQDRLYLNDGTGVFIDATAGRMPVDADGPGSIALGDMDGDGDTDMVLAHFTGGSTQNRLYLNDGAGVFTDATATSLPADVDLSYDVALGDVDGDGDLDIAFANSAADGEQNRLYLNDGTGAFVDATASALPAVDDLTTGVVLSDADADGDLDLVFSNTGQDRLCLNDGSGVFVEATATLMPVVGNSGGALVSGDLDGNGSPDLVSAGGPGQVYLNGGDGTYHDGSAVPLPTDSDDAYATALGDVDGDGDLDIFFGNGSGSSPEPDRLYLNDGLEGFTDVSTTHLPQLVANSMAAAFGDVDGDGDQDLAIACWKGPTNGQNRLYLNDGTGVFSDATASRLPGDQNYTFSLLLEDLDADGDLDLVFGNSGMYGSSRLYLNDGSGEFTDATSGNLPTITGVYDIAAGDVDADGDPDLVLATVFDNRLYLNDGSADFTNASGMSSPTTWERTHGVDLGDVDGDGDLDAVIANSGLNNTGDPNRLYLNDGTGLYTDVTDTRLPADTVHSMGVAFSDVDGDGDLDIIFANEDRYTPTDSDQNMLYLNDGAGFFTDGTAERMQPDLKDTQSLAVGDVDGDGDPDVVFGNLSSSNELHVNLLRQIHAPYLLRTGADYRIDVYARHGPAYLPEVAYLLVSPFPASAPTMYGTLGVDPLTMIVLPPLTVPDPTGVLSLVSPVPDDPSLVGLTVYSQALILDGPFNGNLTNVIEDPVIY